MCVRRRRSIEPWSAWVWERAKRRLSRFADIDVSSSTRAEFRDGLARSLAEAGAVARAVLARRRG
eukprot:11175277-Lingulodinium_polyedra.AAC.1